MKNKFLRKALSVITVMALLLMTGMPFGGIDMSITANAETAVTIDIADLNNGVTSGAGWYYNASNGTLSIDWGYAVTVTGETFTGKVTNRGTIAGGEFSGAVSNEDGAAVINGGTFSGTVTNCSECKINGGVFTKSSTVNNKPKGYIYGGEFYGTVTNETTISSTGNLWTAIFQAVHSKSAQ